MSAASAFVDTAPTTVFLQAKSRARSLGLEHIDSPDGILFSVAARFGVTLAELHSADRHKRIARARHVAMWLMRQGGMSYPEIGRAIGNRDHTTVMSAVRKVEAGLEAEPQWRATLEAMLHRETPRTVYLVAGEGVVFEECETDTGITSGETSSSASSERSQAEGSRA